jgi:Carboxypeptidase regulatory-like domain
VLPGGDPAEIRMQPLAGALHAFVRSKGDRKPVAGATVKVTDVLGQETSAKSQEDGSFSMPVSAKDELTLSITAQGFLPYSEVLQQGAFPRDYELLPAEASARLAAGLTGALAGIAVDERGAPLAGLTLRFTPDRLTPPAVGTRRILDGGVIALQLTTSTGPDGRFVLETQQAGSGRLQAEGGAIAPDQEWHVDVVLGRMRDDLRMVVRKQS